MPRPENADAPTVQGRGAEDNDAGMGKLQSKDNTLFHALAEAMNVPALKYADVRIYAAMLRQPLRLVDGIMTCRPSRARLAKESRVHLVTTAGSIRRLSEAGFVEVEHSRGRHTSIYRLPRLNCSLQARVRDSNSSLQTKVNCSPQATVEQSNHSLQAKVQHPQPLPADKGSSPNRSLQTTQAFKSDTAAGSALRLECEQIASDLSPAGDQEGRFAEFWTCYPRKEAKPAARKAWGRHRLERLADRIIGDVQARIADPGQWTDRKFIPLPASYLNGRRWEDEWQPAAGKRPAGQILRDQRSQEQIDRENEQALRQLEGRAA